MKNEKKQLLELLEDSEVQEKLLSIVYKNNKKDELSINKELEELKKTIIILKDELKAKESKIDEIEHSLSKKNSEVEMLKSIIDKIKELFNITKLDNSKLPSKVESKYKSLENSNTESKEKIKELEKSKAKLKKQLQELQNYCAEDIKIYNLYKALDSKIKEALSGIFKDNSYGGFLACGVQEKNIDSFYEYLKYELIEQRDCKDLITIFNFFQKRFMLSYPNYKLQNIKIGDIFDTQEHIKVGSQIRGEIKEILLYGWINSKNNKIIKKSVVRL